MASEPQQPPIAPYQLLQGVWEPLSSGDLAVFANQMATQFTQGQVLLTFGQMTPPLVSGTPEEQMEQMQQAGPVPIRVIGQFAVPVEAFGQMVAALQQTLAAIEAGGLPGLPGAPSE